MFYHLWILIKILLYNIISFKRDLMLYSYVSKDFKFNIDLYQGMLNVK